MDQTDEFVHSYDDEAEATGWLGPEIAFGLTYAFVKPGQSLLDIGIGTGLGSILFRKAGLEIHGMDISPQMLDACRSKGFMSLHLHDLCKTPYPFDGKSMDHAVCCGVLQFFSNLSPVFQEAGRILKKGGLFVFIVGDRQENGASSIEVGAEHTQSDRTVTMYMHSVEQIAEWMALNGFEPVRNMPFTVFMDREKIHGLPARCYLARKRMG
ncbi:MAG: class I SAM-dependent methyltransferase [Sphaerochaetaceae bacterium]|nr:class I SAM-dependent methyltransferase [Sphaerochaetaceae bacterium]